MPAHNVSIDYTRPTFKFEYVGKHIPPTISNLHHFREHPTIYAWAKDAKVGDSTIRFASAGIKLVTRTR